MESGSNERSETRDTGSGATTQNNGRFALALSGGGFRASFFHIGVLAALADLGMLHKIEVISTVSGGSIVGAYYYLRVKEKIEENWNIYTRKTPAGRSDSELETLIVNDFKEIVKDMEKSFLKAVRKNIRSRVFSHPCKNFKMARSSRYSRSDRISELYDRYFYGKKSIQMKDLKIPAQSSRYSPLRQNDSILFKVPILKINATTLNTGHNWTVEAKHMGEPPLDSDMEIAADKNLRLRRPPGWDDTAPSQSDFRLSDAVAASACVPGLFHPMAISDMYEDFPIDGKLEKITPQLVDGGVHDNLGLAAISDLKVEINDHQGKKVKRDYCDNIIVSDASGQMEDEADPSTNILKVLGRTNSILMDRVREEELFRLYEQCEKSSKKFAFMHLRKKLPRPEVRYLDRNGDPGTAGSLAIPYLDSPEDFGIPLEVQKHLSRIRTDLDSFTDVEAQSLMLDAYLMSIPEVAKRFRNIPQIQPNDDWDFMIFRPILDELNKKNSGQIPPDGGKYKTGRYLKHLKIAGKTTFKVFFLSPIKAFLGLIAIYIVPLVLLIWLFREFLAHQITAFLARPIVDFLPGAAVLAAGILLGSISPFARWLKRNLPKSTIDIIIKILAGVGRWSRIWIHIFTRFLWPTLGWGIVLIHLFVFDSFFKKSGEFEKFLKERH